MAAIQSLLPMGSKVVPQLEDGGYWKISVQTGETVDFEEVGADQRLVALNVYGRLWAASLPKPNENSPWVRRRELTGAQVTRRATNISDPGDLDPSEVQSVYEPFRKP